MYPLTSIYIEIIQQVKVNLYKNNILSLFKCFIYFLKLYGPLFVFILSNVVK